MLKLSKGIRFADDFSELDFDAIRASVILVLSFSILLLPVLSPSQTPPLPQTDVFFSVPPSDAPELAPRGPYAVGVRTVEIKNPRSNRYSQFRQSDGKSSCLRSAASARNLVSRDDSARKRGTRRLRNGVAGRGARFRRDLRRLRCWVKRCVMLRRFAGRHFRSSSCLTVIRVRDIS